MVTLTKPSSQARALYAAQFWRVPANPPRRSTSTPISGQKDTIMNAVLTAPSRQQHSPPARRVGLADRLALRLGLALVLWGRRPVRVRTERFVTHAEREQLARLESARQYPASLRLF